MGAISTRPSNPLRATPSAGLDFPFGTHFPEDSPIEPCKNPARNSCITHVGCTSRGARTLVKNAPDLAAEGVHIFWSTRPGSQAGFARDALAERSSAANRRPPRWQGDAGVDFIEVFRPERSYRCVSVKSGGKLRLTSSELRPSSAIPPGLGCPGQRKDMWRCGGKPPHSK